MAKNREESKPKKILVKIYLLILFVAGMIIGFSYQAAKDKKVINLIFLCKIPLSNKEKVCYNILAFRKKCTNIDL